MLPSPRLRVTHSQSPHWEFKDENHTKPGVLQPECRLAHRNSNLEALRKPVQLLLILLHKESVPCVTLKTSSQGRLGLKLNLSEQPSDSWALAGFMDLKQLLWAHFLIPNQFQIQFF